MRIHVILAFLLMTCVGTAGSVCAQVDTFIFDQFPNADWYDFPIIDLSGTGSHFASQYNVGIPAPSRRVELFIQAQSSAYAMGQLSMTNFASALSFVDISFDADFEAFNSWNCLGVRFTPLVMDTSGVYVANSSRFASDTSSLGWQSFSYRWLTSDSFSNIIPGPAHPDLSDPAPGVRRFGMAVSYTGNTMHFSGGSQASTAFDNLVLALHRTLCACHADPSGCNGFLDVTDVIQTINVAFRGAADVIDPNVICSIPTTDVNCSQATDIVDVVKVINVAFRGVDPAAEFCTPIQ